MNLTKKQQIDALIQEYQRAVTDPVHDDPARYCLVLDLIADELERLGCDPRKIVELVDFSASPY
jgi:hypothetical protein